MPRTKKAPPPVHPFDQRHGTDTSGLLPSRTIIEGTQAKLSEVTAYYGIAPSILRGIVDLWLQRMNPQQPIERTVFLDVGAGKGRAMLLASQYPFARIEGIELNPALVAIAQSNLDRWKQDPRSAALAPILLHHADATTHPMPAQPTLAFLFHPFERAVLRRFLSHIETSQAAKRTPLDLLYVNAEHDSLLDHHPAFSRLWTGHIAMTAEDHLADLAEIAQQKEYGSTGDELCAAYRFTGRSKSDPRARLHKR
jgi:SAM-dependent methyltransferase